MSSSVGGLPATPCRSDSPNLPPNHQPHDSCDSSVYSSQASSCSSSSVKRVHFEAYAEWAYISDQPSRPTLLRSDVPSQRRSGLWKLVGSRNRSDESVVEPHLKEKPAKLVRRRSSSIIQQPTQRRNSWSELIDGCPSLPVERVVVQHRTNFHVVKQPLQDVPGKPLTRYGLHAEPNTRSPLFSNSVTQSSKGAWDDLFT
jgi:hypothetical protein